MNNDIEQLRKLGISLPEILLPAEYIDLEKWPVVACDQYTSEPEYWEEVSKIVGKSPSTLNLILPECYLGEVSGDKRIAAIQKTMKEYLDSGVFVKAPEGAHLVVRHLPGKPSRTGLIIAIDLESYDYNRESTSRIRPTEGTIISRIPARKRVRAGAVLEIPHVMVLLDDPGRTVIEPLAEAALGTAPVYSTPLLKNGGTLEAYRITAPDKLKSLVRAFRAIADPGIFQARYNSNNPFFIAIGDGNHSLAAAKAYWEDLKAELPEDRLENHPARHAMVEAVNIYDEGISFEPIHRLFFDIDPERLLAHFSKTGKTRFIPVNGESSRLREPGAGEVGFYSSDISGMIEFETGSGSETTAAAQGIIDSFLSASDCRIDFVHDLPKALELAHQPGNACCIMPKITKDEFFGFIVKNGCYPRKSFSMGESNEKRYYMEARIIRA